MEDEVAEKVPRARKKVVLRLVERETPMPSLAGSSRWELVKLELRARSVTTNEFKLSIRRPTSSSSPKPKPRVEERATPREARTEVPDRSCDP